MNKMLASFNEFLSQDIHKNLSIYLKKVTRVLPSVKKDDCNDVNLPEKNKNWMQAYKGFRYLLFKNSNTHQKKNTKKTSTILLFKM